MSCQFFTFACSLCLLASSSFNPYIILLLDNSYARRSIVLSVAFAFRLFHLQYIPNRRQNSFEIICHVTVSKADHAIAFLFKESGAFSVVLILFQMLTADEFDNEFVSRRAEVSDVMTNGML